MKITLESKALLEKLQFVSGVIPSNPTLPMLGNFLLEVEDGTLKITASDLETTICATMEIDSQESTKIAIPAKMLIEILKAIPDQPLTFEPLDNSTMKIASVFGEYSIAYENGDQFPTLPELEKSSSITIPSKVLSNAISKTVFATSNDDLRPMMTGVLFELTQTGTNFVATDAHKLVKYSREDIKAEEASQFIVPKKPLSVLKSILAANTEDVEVKYNGVNAVFELDSYTLSCRLIDAKYPNYEAVIPKENPNVLTIDRVLLLNSMKCVSIFSNKTTHQVRFDIKGTELRVSAEDIDYSNKADERLTCNYSGDDFTIGFNARLLIEILTILQCETVQIAMSTPNRAGIMTPVTGLSEGELLLMLLMPVVINK